MLKNKRELIRLVRLNRLRNFYYKKAVKKNGGA